MFSTQKRLLLLVEDHLPIRVHSCRFGRRSRWREMTPPKQTEETVHNREAHIVQLVDVVPDAVVIVRQDGTIMHINTQTERLFGYARDELIGQAVEVLLPERFRRRHHEHLTRYVAAPSPRPMGTGLDLFARRKNGTTIRMERAAGCQLQPLVGRRTTRWRRLATA